MRQDRHWICILTSVAALLLTACASHPPICKGPYAPINDPTSATAHDAKR
jgi:hypothetical protein